MIRQNPPDKPKIPAKRVLKNLADVRRYLSSVINETRRGEIEPALAGKLGYLLNILVGVISQSDLEARIEKLEKESRQ